MQTEVKLGDVISVKKEDVLRVVEKLSMALEGESATVTILAIGQFLVQQAIAAAEEDRINFG